MSKGYKRGKPGDTANRTRKKHRVIPKIKLKVENGIIINIEFTANRKSFSAATKRFLNEQFPELASGSMNVREGIDRRHWQSNLEIKKTIKEMVIGQRCEDVANRMVTLGVVHNPPTEIEELESALDKLWRVRFNDINNLRLGPSIPNQALGSLAAELNRIYNQNKNDRSNFQGYQVKMERFGWGVGVVFEIEDWRDLCDMMWNANYDFVFNGEAAAELERAEQLFWEAHPGDQ